MSNMPNRPFAPIDMTLPSEAVDIKLVFSDMDGTLLNQDGLLPGQFFEVYAALKAKGIPFVPASGRQLATLRHVFGDLADELSYVAENGNMVVHNDEIVSATVMDPELVAKVEGIVKHLGRVEGRDIGLVVCGHKSAYTERTDFRFLQEVRKYYAELAIVPDMTTIPDKVCKLAIFDFDSAAEARPAFVPVEADAAVVASSENWIDIMDPKVNKGVAVRAMQKALDIKPESTVAFGDFLNDLEMLQSVGISFAMANAHPEIKKIAKYGCPSNTESGVLTTLAKLISL